MDLRRWFLQCKYPLSVINKKIHSARLQGPANKPITKTTIPFISTYYSNFDSSNILETAKNLIQNSTNTSIQEIFSNVQFIHARRQPPNLLRQISNAAFIQGETEMNPGIHLCDRSNCKMCKMYLQKCKSFITANGTEWIVKCEVTCNSMNTLYFQVCSFCNEVSNLGKTDNFRFRTNNHVTGARHGTSDALFDQHVYECSRSKGVPHQEPYFRLNAFMVVNDYSKLRNIERKFHLRGYDSINKPHS